MKKYIFKDTDVFGRAFFDFSALRASQTKDQPADKGRTTVYGFSTAVCADTQDTRSRQNKHLVRHARPCSALPHAVEDLRRNSAEFARTAASPGSVARVSVESTATRTAASSGAGLCSARPQLFLRPLPPTCFQSCARYKSSRFQIRRGWKKVLAHARPTIFKCPARVSRSAGPAGPVWTSGSRGPKGCGYECDQSTSRNSDWDVPSKLWLLISSVVPNTCTGNTSHFRTPDTIVECTCRVDFASDRTLTRSTCVRDNWLFAIDLRIFGLRPRNSCWCTNLKWDDLLRLTVGWLVGLSGFTQGVKVF